MRVAIVGAGIAGLTTALALQKRGFSPVVFEQADELKEVGAGIWIQPNALNVFNKLGIDELIKENGIELNRLEITDSQLNPIKEMRKEVAHDDEGYKIIAIHRATLLNILFQQVKKTTQIYLGKEYVSHETHDQGVSLRCKDGIEEVDIILGADGIHSQVRKLVVPNSVLRNSGQLCWRGVAKFTLPESLRHSGKEAWGKQIRFGFSQVSAKEVYWFAVVRESAVNHLEISNTKQVVEGFFRGFSPVVSELIAHTETEAIHQAVLHDLRKLSTWYGDRVCLLGDAAHATTPNMGQGACQGIEDAYYISRYLSSSRENARDAFKLFENQRRKKVDHIVNTSWRFGKMAHSISGQALMKLLLRLTPESVIRWKMNRLYHVNL